MTWNATIYQRERYARDEEYAERRRAYARKFGARRRKIFQHMLTEYKLAAGCAYCGYNAHPDALQFDHPEGRKGALKFQPRSFKQLEGLSALQVLCANCHAIKSTEEQRKRFTCL